MKKIYQSKTVWLNIIVGIIAIATLVNPELLSALGIDESRQKDVLTLVGTVTAIANLLLRVVTNKGLTMGSNNPE